MIGIVGGVGPYAGIDLARKIFDNTIASKDQDHLPVCLLSFPERIRDRTAFLLGQESENPGKAIAEIILKLEQVGAKVVGIPCNTAHSPRIFQEMKNELADKGCGVKVLNMIEETAAFILQQLPNVKEIGVLSTTGTQKTALYPDIFSRFGLKVLAPQGEKQDRIHQAIYDTQFGIKAFSNPVTDRAIAILREAIRELAEQGAGAVVLGCTELPLAITESIVDGCRIIDPTNVLARALIRETFPEKLKPLKGF